MKSSVFLYIIVVLFSSVIFISCNKNDNSVEPPEGLNTIKIGALFSYSTGDWTTLGKTSKAALDIAQTQINSYLISINSENRISVTYKDTYLNPDSALSQIKQFYADGIRIIIGPQSSSEAGKVKSFIDSTGMIVISQGSTAGSLSISGDNIFRFCPVDSMEAKSTVALMNYDTVKYMIPVYRTDIGNTGLYNSVSGYFSSTISGGILSSAISYPAGTTDFTSIVQQIKAKIQSAPAGKKVGVYLAAFDENVQLFNAALSEPLLSSVKWYGSDGVVQSAVLTGNTSASQFASLVGYDCPIFGLDSKSAPIRALIEPQIISATGIQPDAFSFAAYDAFYVASLAANNIPEFNSSAFKIALVQNANTYFGASGWTELNASGDRKFANFDFWGVRLISGTYQWKIVSRYNSNTGAIEIVN